jgi:hypothetical protein
MKYLALLLALLAATPALADDNVLLIQLQPGGAYKVWHTEGESRLADDDVMALEAAASREGSTETPTGFGPARAYETPDGIVISLPAVTRDKFLLLDRDDCGHVRVWHSAGATNLPDEQITDIFMSALPGGGKRLTLGGYHVKGFVTRLGVTASLWKIKPKNPAQ